MQLLLAATVVAAWAAPSAPATPRSADPARVTIFTDADGPFRTGEMVRIRVEVTERSHVAVLRIDSEGRPRVLFPDHPWDDTYLSPSAGAARQRADEWAFRIDDLPGIGYVFAVASAAPLDLAAISSGDHWDLRIFEGGRLRGDPYAALSRLAARLAPGAAYDYDIAPYYIGRRYEYPRFVCYDCHAGAGAGWDPYGEECPRFDLVASDDPRYYPYRQYERRAVAPPRPARLEPRYEFRDRMGPPRSQAADGDEGDDAELRRRVEEADAPPQARPVRRLRTDEPRPAVRRDAPDSVRARRPAPRSLGEPELRRRRPDSTRPR